MHSGRDDNLLTEIGIKALPHTSELQTLNPVTYDFPPTLMRTSGVIVLKILKKIKGGCVKGSRHFHFRCLPWGLHEVVRSTPTSALKSEEGD